MRLKVLPWFLLGLTACRATVHLPPHAPPEEAARFQLPLGLPSEGVYSLDGNMAAAIHLAMEDFLPWKARPAASSRPEEACLFRRESYDVTAVPAPEGVMLVRFALDLQACPPVWATSVDAATGLPPLETTTYAVDVRHMRILSRGVQVRRLP
jgi:hypothetical protein